MPPRISPKVRLRAAKIKLFICDVDGVMTDGTVWMGGGVESKRFNIRDGLGLKFLQRCGIKVGWVSRRPSRATKQRADDLRIDFLAQKDSGKIEVVEELLRQTGLNWDEVCFVGDDVVDVGVMNRAGLAVAVGDAVAEAKAAAHYVTGTDGGLGAVREAAELILKAQNKWKSIMAEHAN